MISMRNRICGVFGIDKPLIQGAMAWASNAPLVAAVSEAGGLGVLGVGFAPVEYVKLQIQKTKELTIKPFAINVFIETEENLAKITKIAIEEQVPVIYADTIIGLDEELTAKYIEIWHEHGMKVVVKASILNDAVIADRAGADAVIIKGWEAGGHVTYETTMTLVPLAVETLSCPVIAGGGIIDGKGIVAALALGAAGIEMGSAFLMSEECDVHPNVKAAIKDAGDMSTTVTGASTDEPCRQLINPLSEKMAEIETSYPKKEAAEKIRKIAGSSLRLAMEKGDLVNGAVMVGQCASRLNQVKRAVDIINEAIDEANLLLTELKNISL